MRPQKGRNLKYRLSVDLQNCAIRPDRILAIRQAARYHDLEPASLAYLFVLLQVEQLLEVKLVPPIQKVHSDCISYFIEVIVYLHAASNACIVSTETSRMIVFTASLAAKIFMNFKKSTADAVLEYLVSFFENLYPTVICLQYFTQGLGYPSLGQPFKHFFLLFRWPAPCGSIDLLPIKTAINCLFFLLRHFQLWFLHQKWGIMIRLSSLGEGFQWKWLGCWNWIIVLLKGQINWLLWREIIDVVNTIRPIIHIMKSGLLQLVVKGSLVKRLRILRQCCWLPEPFLEHLIGPNTIEKVKLVQNFMHQRFCFQRNALKSWILQGSCNSIPSSIWKYLLMLLKATTPRNTDCCIILASSERGWRSRSRISKYCAISSRQNLQRFRM